MQAANLDSAVTAALLLLPAAFSNVDLFRVICGLSYMADIRMVFAEDSRKVGASTVESALCTPPLQAVYAAAEKQFADSARRLQRASLQLRSSIRVDQYWRRPQANKRQ